MATKLYLRNVTESGITVTGYAGRTLDPQVGSNIGADASGTPTASGNHIELPSAGKVIWLYRVNAVTVSGTISVEICGIENNMADNVQPAVRVVRVDNTGSILSDVVANANANHASGVEHSSTVLTRNSWTITPTSTTFSSGDWVGVIVHGDAIGTMSAGSAAVWCRYDGSNVNTGDSNLTFTETISAFGSAAADTVPYVGGGYYGYAKEFAERARRRYWRSGWDHRPSGVLVPC